MDPRKSQIAMVELFATVVALTTFAKQLCVSWSFLMVDSEPVRVRWSKATLRAKIFVNCGECILEISF